MQVVLASGNTHKVSELQALLPSLSLVGQDEFGIEPVPETGTTFIENALIKARHAALQSGLPALADDSGLVVPALGGAPGIYSARYAGVGASDSDNNRKLLAALADSTRRDAFFYCYLVLLNHADDPTPVIATGCWHGEIAHTPSGNQGFGYDPLFIVRGTVSGHPSTAAQLSQDEKGMQSHRGLAARQLHDLLSTDA